jgi:hypothetical protein
MVANDLALAKPPRLPAAPAAAQQPAVVMLLWCRQDYLHLAFSTIAVPTIAKRTLSMLSHKGLCNCQQLANRCSCSQGTQSRQVTILLTVDHDAISNLLLSPVQQRC